MSVKCVFGFSLQLLSETFLVLRRTGRVMIKTYTGLHVKYPLFIGLHVKYPLFIGLHVKDPLFIGLHVKYPLFIGLHVKYPLLLSSFNP